MPEKTKEEIQEELEATQSELRLVKALKEERDLSDNRYARKIIEGIVFSIVGIFALAALYFIFIKVGLPKP